MANIININLNIQLIRNQQLLASSIDDELTMMDEAKGHYYGLNSVAKKIWELLETPQPYQTLLNTLCDLYAVDKQRCHHDVDIFISQMIKHSLIHVLAEDANVC